MLCSLKESRITERPFVTPRSSIMARPRYTNPFTEELIVPYLEALEKTGQYIRAADAVQVQYKETVAYRKENPEFQELCNEAMERFSSQFIDAARNRAVDGWKEPIVGGRERNEIVAHKINYSDRLLELFLKRSPSGAFTDKQEVVIVDGVQMRSDMDYSTMSTRARKLFRELLEVLNEDNYKRAMGETVE